MAFGEFRVVAFSEYLTLNNIPFSGLSQNGDAPEGITINFEPEATVEQIAWAENAKAEYDWRKRKLRSQADLTLNFNGLSQGEKATLQANAFAIVARTNPTQMKEVLALAGIDLPLDEVDEENPT
jgi:hypothetical protein